MADGSESDNVKVDTLTEASEEEYEAELARWAALRAQFKKGVYAKTAEGAAGVAGDAVATGGGGGGGGCSAGASAMPRQHSAQAHEN